MKNKIIVFCLLVALFTNISFLCFAQHSFAINNSEDYPHIIAALKRYEPIKESTEFANIDFSNLYVSDSIFTYDYSSEGIVLNSEWFPVKYNEQLVLWVIKTQFNEETLYQVSLAYIDQVRDLIHDDTSFALIYDDLHCYLYDGATLFALNEIPFEGEGKEVLNSTISVKHDSIKLGNISNSYFLNYQPSNNNARISSYVGCTVPFVSQNPPSDLCWAASIASIVNSIKGTNYTAVQVAQNHYGYSNYNQGLTYDYADNVLNTYGLSYSYKNAPPSDPIISRNVRNGYPLCATFTYSTGSSTRMHAVVIYGINALSGYIYLMDPEDTFCDATFSSSAMTYVYVSGYAGRVMTLYSAACYYTTAT